MFVDKSIILLMSGGNHFFGTRYFDVCDVIIRQSDVIGKIMTSSKIFFFKNVYYMMTYNPTKFHRNIMSSLEIKEGGLKQPPPGIESPQIAQGK